MENIGMEKGLYEVRIERTNMFFDPWMGVTEDLEIKYVFVNNYEAFEKWLEDIYTGSNGFGINYREVVSVSYNKISDNVTVLN